MTTLNDVAVRARVSKATASRALNRPHLVAAQTVERVRMAAAELAFTPNRAAQHLAGGRTGIVTLLVPTLHNTFFTPIIGGAQMCAEAAGLHLTVVVHPLEDEGEWVRFEHLAAQVDGLIIVAPRGEDEIVQRAGIIKPTVLVDREIAGMNSVVADTAVAFGSLVTELADSGHERIVYLNGPDRSWQNLQRTAAVRAAASEAGAHLDVLGPVPALFAAGAGLVDKVVATGATAALPYASDLGLGLLLGLISRGLGHVGGTSPTAGAIDVVGIPGAPRVEVDGEALGNDAMEHLLAMLGGGTPASAQRRLNVPVSWPRVGCC